MEAVSGPDTPEPVEEVELVKSVPEPEPVPVVRAPPKTAGLLNFTITYIFFKIMNC